MYHAASHKTAPRATPISSCDRALGFAFPRSARTVNNLERRCGTADSPASWRWGDSGECVAPGLLRGRIRNACTEIVPGVVEPPAVVTSWRWQVRGKPIGKPPAFPARICRWPRNRKTVPGNPARPKGQLCFNREKAVQRGRLAACRGCGRHQESCPKTKGKNHEHRASSCSRGR